MSRADARMFQRWREQVAHSQERFLERHGIEVSVDDLRDMATQIKEGRALSVVHKPNIYAVRHGHRHYQVAYDSKTQMVSTVFS